MPGVAGPAPTPEHYAWVGGVAFGAAGPVGVGLVEMLHVFVVTRGRKGGAVSHARSPIGYGVELRVLLQHGSQALEVSAVGLEILNNFGVWRRVGGIEGAEQEGGQAQDDENEQSH